MRSAGPKKRHNNVQTSMEHFSKRSKVTSVDAVISGVLISTASYTHEPDTRLRREKQIQACPQPKHKVVQTDTIVKKNFGLNPALRMDGAALTADQELKLEFSFRVKYELLQKEQAALKKKFDREVTDHNAAKDRMKWLSLKYAEKKGEDATAAENARLKVANEQLKAKIEDQKADSLAVAKASSMMVDKLFELGWTVVENNETREIVICETVEDDDMLDEMEIPDPAGDGDA